MNQFSENLLLQGTSLSPEQKSKANINIQKITVKIPSETKEQKCIECIECLYAENVEEPCNSCESRNKFITEEEASCDKCKYAKKGANEEPCCFCDWGEGPNHNVLFELCTEDLIKESKEKAHSENNTCLTCCFKDHGIDDYPCGICSGQDQYYDVKKVSCNMCLSALVASSDHPCAACIIDNDNAEICHFELRDK